jgi:hypothetical protein
MKLFATLLLLLLGLTACESGPIRAAKPDLRRVNWEAAVRDNPNLNFSPMPSFQRIQGYYVETPDGKVSGFAQTNAITYGDISGDGREEAIVPLIRDGRAGVTGLLLYRAGESGAELVTALGGIQMSHQIQDGTLVVDQAGMAGWEEPCCPSGVLTTRYRLQDGELKALSEKVEPRNQARLPTVLKYYALLNEQKWQDSYRFLSPAYQQANPYDRWLAAAQQLNLSSLTARDVPGGRVSAEITENDPNAPTIRQSTVTWSLVWSPELKQWQLDKADVQSAS